MAIKTKRMSDWLAQNGDVITAASKASMLKAIRNEVPELNDGVYIYFNKISDNSNFPNSVSVKEWKEKYMNIELANGVLVIQGGKSLVVAPTEATLPISSNQVDLGLSKIGDRKSALEDWDGKANTEKILAASSTSNITNTEAYAAGYCNKYSRINKFDSGIKEGKWWLPSVGEMNLIFSNYDKINYALQFIDGAQPLKDWYWTSTEASITNNWDYMLSIGFLNFWHGKKESYSVRPVSYYDSYINLQ